MRNDDGLGEFDREHVESMWDRRKERKPYLTRQCKWMAAQASKKANIAQGNKE